MQKLDLDKILDLNPGLDREYFKNHESSSTQPPKKSGGGITSPYSDRGASAHGESWVDDDQRRHRPHYKASQI